MTKLSNKFNTNKISLKSILAVVATLLLGLVIGKVTTTTITPETDGNIIVESGFTMELSEEQVPTILETANGEVEVIEAPTVESVDGNNLIDECGENEECGKGWWVDTSTPEAFKNAVLGQCIDTDGHYGSQCWDLANLYWQNAADRTLSTCGTGAAKGTINCWEQNAGNEFEMIWEPTQLKSGDIVVFTNGVYGHIGMALGSYNNGYIALLGTNQGGAACLGGGSAANIINISLKNFGGAFRPKSYIVKEEPKEEVQEEVSTPTVDKCTEWQVQAGDTMSSIMLACRGEVEYGNAMDDYANSWQSVNTKPGQTVYTGWNSETGVGLYAGDVIRFVSE